MDDSHVSSLHDSVESNSSHELLDRLSELPDSLILVILSFLPMKDVVRTTILSKRWKDIWTIVPCLHFRHSTCNDFDKFRIFVCWSLLRWRGAKILKFSINFLFDDSMADDIDLLLLFAISNQVEELHIELTPSFWQFHASRSNYYAPHQCLYSCSSITKLTLVSVELNISESVRWDQLKSLAIEGADYSLSEHAMNQIVSGAPLLEVLNLRIKESSDNLNVESTSLKMLKINMCGSGSENNTVLRIWAPNLEALEISGLSYTRCLLKVPSLTNAILGFDKLDYFTLLGEMLTQVFLSICHVGKLSLTDLCIKVLFEMKKDIFVIFSNATFLKLYPIEADGMLDVLEMFPELMILIVERNEFNSLFQDEEPYAVTLAPKTVSPNLPLLQLKTVDITWNVRDASIIPVVEILLENARVLEKMVLRIRTHGDDPETFILVQEKVLSMLRSSPYAEVVVTKVILPPIFL